MNQNPRKSSASPAQASTELPSPLSLSDRARGRRRYLVFATFNAFSYALLAEGMVVLLLLRLGAGERWVGWVSSIMFLTLPFMVVGYRLIPRLGVSGTAGAFWSLRSMSALFLIAAPWAAGLGGSLSLWLVLAGTLGFMLGRAGGLAAFTGIITELTTTRDRGDLLGLTFRYFQGGAILVTLLVAVFLGDNAPLWFYQVFFAVGLACGLVAAWALWTLPEAGLFRNGVPFSLLKEMRWVLGTPGRRWFLAMSVSVPVSQGLWRTMLLLLVKQGYGLSDQIAVSLLIVTMVGGVLASYSYGLFLDRLGSRPLMVITGFIDILAAVGVLLLPETVNWPLLGAIFLINGYVHTALQSSSQHYFLSITDNEHQLPQGIITQGAGGLTAGATLAGAGIALATLRLWGDAGLLPGTAGDPLLHFRWLFVAFLVFLTLRILVFFRLPPLRSKGIRESLNALISPWDWRAVHAVKRAVAAQGEDDETHALRTMMRSTAGVYSDELERYLASPSYFVRRRALDSLIIAKPTPELTTLLIEDLHNNPFTTAHQSAHWLGRWRVEAAIPSLREAITNPDFRLAGAAIHALVEMDERSTLDLVEHALAGAENPLLLIEAARAISMWGSQRHYPLLLEQYHRDIPPQAKDELSLSVARLLGLYGNMYKDLGMLHREPDQLHREWAERLLPQDAEGLILALEGGNPRRSLLQATLARRREAFRDWFVEPTDNFLAKRPERVFPEMAFMMTLLLLSSEGLHLKSE